MSAASNLWPVDPCITESEAEDRRQRRPWTRERLVRLGFLFGQGRTTAEIARDPLVGSSQLEVLQQAYRYGLIIAKGSDR